MKDDDEEKKPPGATVSRIPRRVARGPQGDFGHGWPPGHFGPVDESDPKYIEQRKKAERHIARSTRTNYIEQLAGVILVASIKAGREKLPVECIAKATEMADALGMGVAECDKQ